MRATRRGTRRDAAEEREHEALDEQLPDEAPREAPSDSRTAISFCRMKPRAISRFATLAQAMSSTRPTMHISTMSAVEKSLRRPE